MHVKKVPAIRNVSTPACMVLLSKRTLKLSSLQKLRISRVIPRKIHSFQEILRARSLKIRKNDSENFRVRVEPSRCTSITETLSGEFACRGPLRAQGLTKFNLA